MRKYAIILICGILVVPSLRAATIYYVSSSGSNSDAGTIADPWKDVDALDSTTFGSGDQILFKRGETFAGACTLEGSGADGSPILIGAYDTGDKPLLTGDTDAAEIFKLTNNEYIEFQNLQLSNFNTSNSAILERYAIHIAVPVGSGEINHLHFKELDFFDIQGYGKTVHEVDHRSTCILAQTVDSADSDTASGRSRFSDFLIEGCTFTDIDGLGVQLRDFSQDIADKKIRNTDYFPTIGFVFQNNYGTNIYRNLLMTRGTKDALVQYNTMDTTVEGSAFWPFACDHTVVQFNVFKHLYADDADAFVCHFDFNCIDLLMQYNFGYDVQGGLIEYIVYSRYQKPFQENGIARYNIGIDVGYRDDVNGAGIFLTGRVTGGQFYNNTIIQLSKPQYQAISFGSWGGEWPNNNEIYNNIFYAADTNSTYGNEGQFTLLGNSISHNLYYGNISPTSADANSFTGDPLFADISKLLSNPEDVTPDDLKVTFGSVAISNGLLIAGNGERDYFDYTVSTNSPPTIGFHEYLGDPVIDSDADGMADQWELQYSLNPTNPADSALDPDTDGVVSGDEYIANTDPTNSASVFQISLDPPRLVWEQRPGRVYRAWQRDDLTDPSSWNLVETNFVVSPYEIETTASPQFYKLDVQLP